MNNTYNDLNQPIGLPLPEGWAPPSPPPYETLAGRFCRLEPLSAERHAVDLFAAYSQADAGLWTYLPYGPFAAQDDYTAWVNKVLPSSDPLFYAIINAQSGQAEGIASYLRITPASGSIEVGHINYAPALQRTPAATEAMFLMMKHAFDLGYRRYEWKCDALNAPSRLAAQRLGFSYEGIFRQATLYRGRNRDTAWFAVIDQEWPALRAAFQQWLDPANFDAAGQQRQRLSDLTAPLLYQTDPEVGSGE
ncbi:MAG: GNAT family N-acetyltransferase [Anaerolineae bacterium]|nr:GNAT family N-acetyltransferase [Anaerolineae bacterium]